MKDEKMKDELTKYQLSRQDFVDNNIAWIVNELIPDGYNKLKYNQNWVADVRQAINLAILEQLDIDISSKEADDFDMKFYPYLDYGWEDAEDEE